MTSLFSQPESTLQNLHLETYLRLQLDRDTQAALPMKQMQEVLMVPVDRLTLIPNMPPWTLGLLNQRSRIFWALDLPQLLGLSPLESNLPEYAMAIVRVDNQPTGLAVRHIYGVTRFPVEAIQSPVGVVSPSLEPYLKGCVLKSEGILWVLEASAILQAQRRSQFNSQEVN